jgi:hypothetical protein
MWTKTQSGTKHQARFSLDFVRELRFATSVEGTWWKRSVLNTIWRLSGRELKGTNCDVKKQFEQSKNDEH